MAKEETNKVKEGKGKEKIEGNIHQKEMVEEFNKTPLTQQVTQLRGEVHNLNKGISELLDLFKEVLKKQTNTEVMIEDLVPKINENIAKVSKQIEHITPTKDKIVNSIFSGKNMGGLESINSSSVEKVNMHEYVHTIEMGDYNSDKYSPENFNDKSFDKISFRDKKTAQAFMLYCMNVFLSLKNEGIKIENIERKEDISGRTIFCTGQGYSWTINDIIGIIKNYYGTKYSTQNILEYILYLHKKY